MDRKIMLPADLKEEAKRRKIRIKEEERKKIIFNNKKRIIGVDLDGLEKQVQEKYHRKLEERSFDDYMHRMQKDIDRKIDLIDQQVAKDKREISKELDRFRRINQQRKTRTNDTQVETNPFKVGSKYVSEEDQRYLLTSVQRFDSEYDSPKERLREQRRQQRAWLHKQMDDRRRTVEEKKKVDRLATVRSVALDKRLNEISDMERQCRKDIAKSLEEFNQIIAMEKMNKMRISAKDEQDDNLTEVKNTLTSDLMTERVLAVPSSLNLGRIVTTTYKGLSQEQRQQIHESQLEQIRENQERQRARRLEEEKWNNLSKAMLIQQQERDKNNQQERRNTMKALLWENEKLAHDQREKKRYMERNVHRVVPATDQFYSKFNTSSR